MGRLLSLILICALWLAVFASARETARDRASEIIGGVAETGKGSAIREEITERVNDTAAAIKENITDSSNEAAEEAAKKAIEGAVKAAPLPPAVSIQVNDVTLTPTTVGAETVIVIEGKFGGSASANLSVTKSSNGTITATASSPSISLPPGVPLQISPNENIKAANATLVIQTSPDSTQPISSVSVSVETPKKGEKAVTLTKVESGVAITSQNVQVFTEATIKVEDQHLYVTTPTKSYKILLPEDISSLQGQNIQSAALAMSSGTPAYYVNSTKTSNFLGAIPISYPVQSVVYAQSGQVQSTEIPWWAELLFGK